MLLIFCLLIACLRSQPTLSLSFMVEPRVVVVVVVVVVVAGSIFTAVFLFFPQMSSGTPARSAASATAGDATCCGTCRWSAARRPASSAPTARTAPSTSNTWSATWPPSTRSSPNKQRVGQPSVRLSLLPPTHEPSHAPHQTQAERTKTEHWWGLNPRLAPWNTSPRGVSY